MLKRSSERALLEVSSMGALASFVATVAASRHCVSFEDTAGIGRLCPWKLRKASAAAATAKKQTARKTMARGESMRSPRAIPFAGTTLLQYAIFGALLSSILFSLLSLKRALRLWPKARSIFVFRSHLERLGTDAPCRTSFPRFYYSNLKTCTTKLVAYPIEALF
jgi:hypothetical protein